MTTIQPFDFKGTNIRVLTIDGEPWFVGKDVAQALGYVDTSRAVRDHVPPGQKREGESPAPSDLQELDPQTVLISEAGMYRLVMRSRTAAAEVFQEWVTAEVLPSIRKTGSYALVHMTPAEIILLQAQQLVDLERRAAAVEAVVAVTAEKTREVEMRLDAVEGRHGWYAAQGYAAINGHDTGTGYLNKVGRRASRIGTAVGLRSEWAPHALYGRVRSWPESVWAQAFDEVG